MRKILFLFLLLTTNCTLLNAEEGLWIPVLLEQLNIKQMQDMGFRLSAEDIYSVNHASLKDAIVQFGSGCTGEIISGEGLLLTNHHCGLGSVQRHSTLQNDYLKNGFWASTKDAELVNPGLTVTLLISMEDVTAKVLKGVTGILNSLQRQQRIKHTSDSIEKAAVTGTHYEARIRPFYYGNQYYMFITEVFKDVRLVGAPPEAIGQFGGDTDNWVWPRHGADFSLFRIYVNKNNEPAEYAKDNVPYKPRKFLSISLKGYTKGDFTFVFGYPGVTREYLTSFWVDLTAHKENPVRIMLRQKRLDIMNVAMNADALVRIQYTSKHQAIANGWKKMIGESKGIDRLDAIQKKKQYEIRFRLWVDSIDRVTLGKSGKFSNYHHLLENFDSIYRAFLPVDLSGIYLTEAGMGIELVKFASGYRALVKISKTDTVNPVEIRTTADKFISAADAFFKDYNPQVDKQVFISMMGMMKDNMDLAALPVYFETIRKKFDGDFRHFGDEVFRNSIFADSARLKRFLKKYSSGKAKILEKDPMYQLAAGIYDQYEHHVIPQITSISATIDSLQRIFMAGQMEMDKNRRFYPDANSTLRVSYGKVEEYSPADGIDYKYYTTSKGILQKENPDIYDYTVDPRLKDLFMRNDFGRYGDKNNLLHIAFIASNHTTGGNSGSPVLNAEGNLIGVNFDRNWEGTMSDLMYDPDQCRNISLDIRYCLFIIDKYAGAHQLIREMNILE